MPDLSLAEAIVRLVLAAGLGAAIGLERELRDHEAGLRTHLLVSLGACLFTLVSAHGWSDWRFSTPEGVVFDPTRIAAQIVTGIGFLGAGAIIVRGVSVKGLTTAASVWVVAAIGMAAGAGLYAVSAAATALVILSLYPLRLFARRWVDEIRDEKGTLVVHIAASTQPSAVIDAVQAASGKPLHVEIAEGRVVLDLRAGHQASRIADALAALDGVESVEWTP